MKVWCIILDEQNKPIIPWPFSVDVELETTVDALKKVIKDRAMENFANLAYFNLAIWHYKEPALTKFPDPENLQRLLSSLKLGSDPKAIALLPPQTIGSINYEFDAPRLDLLLIKDNSNSNGRRLAKRPRLGYNHGDPGSFLFDLGVFQRRYWGIPLEKALTELPEDLLRPGLDSDNELLHDSAFLSCFGVDILVRAEYIRVFDAVKKQHSQNSKHIAVVTGQSGIGKSLWIRYAMRRCLGEKQQVVWYRHNTFFLFSEAGVEVVSQIYDNIPASIWCFVDALDADILPSTISDRDMNFFPIYVASLEPRRLNSLSRSRPFKLVIMNPWTRAEIDKAASLPQYSMISPEEIAERFENTGPIPRTCLELSREQLNFYNNTYAVGIRLDLAISYITGLLTGKHSGDNDGSHIENVGHRVCLIRRSDSKDMVFVFEPISPFVRNVLLTQVRGYTEAERHKMMKDLEQIPSAAEFKDLLFESHD